MTVTTTTTTLRPTKIISSVKLVTLVSSTEKTPTYALPQSSVDFQMATFSKTPIQLSLSTTLPATTTAHITIPTTTTTKRTTTHHHDCVTSGQYVLFQHSNILTLHYNRPIWYSKVK